MVIYWRVSTTEHRVERSKVARVGAVREGPPQAGSGPREAPREVRFGSERDADARRPGRRYRPLSEK